MKTSETVQRPDVELILVTHTGNRKFGECLQQIQSNDELICLLGRYIHFNSVFGSGVANLAGEIGARQDLFLDPDEAIMIAADRSVEVAADIFFAAIDEFGDRSVVQRSTHRTLAQATLKATGDFFGCAPAQLNELTRPNEGTLAAIRKVRNGYGLNQSVEDQKIFHAIGFHMGSEILADEEFHILDGYLRDSQPELVDHLKSTKVAINDTENAAYRWIQIHTSVEADHFDAALIGAGLALQYYAGPESRTRVKDWVLEGLRDFANMQSEFTENLMCD